MAHYIDKDALVAEIDRQKIGYNTDGKHPVEYNTVKKILDILDTLEAKEVDLEKEIDEWCNKCISDYELEGWVGVAIQNVAKHFFELGLKQNKVKQEDKVIWNG